MFTPIAALLEQEILLTGEGSLLNRPIDFFGEILPQLNVQVATNNGKLPTTIKGVLQAKNIEIDGSLSSQFLTGLLFAYSSPLAFGNWVEGEANIKVNNLKSKPYIDLTLQVMQDFGLNIPENKDYKEFVFTNQPINQSTNQPVNYSIEGDWSNAAFLLVAGAIAGDITVKGLNINSTQADKAILDVLENIGCNITIASNEITVSCPPLGVGNAFHFDATDCPDLFPPLVALASCCKGVSTITGVTRLQHKESNRANSLQQEFAKMGVEITLDNDTMFIEGTTQIQAAIVHSHNDHRIAMACAVAALKANGNIVIEKAEAINKSYPDFFGDLKKVGGVLD
jgi:3-phosphoshikimate 1-carboxyvinyltransferase